jgi:tetratricopeptide (TPR) repeat protein
MSADRSVIDASNQLRSAVIAASTGAFERAELELEALLNDPTARDWALYDLAMLHLQRDDPDRASSELSQAAESADPVIRSAAAFHLAHLAHLNGNRNEEQRWLGRVDPASRVGSSAALNRAGLQFDRGDVDGAVDSAWEALIRAPALSERLFAFATLARIQAPSDRQFARRYVRVMFPILFPGDSLEPEDRKHLISLSGSIRQEMQRAANERRAVAASTPIGSVDGAIFEGVNLRDRIHEAVGGSRQRPLSRANNPDWLIAIVSAQHLHRTESGAYLVLRHRTLAGLRTDQRLIDRRPKAKILVFDSVDRYHVRFAGFHELEESSVVNSTDLRITLNVLSPVQLR